MTPKCGTCDKKVALGVFLFMCMILTMYIFAKAVPCPNINIISRAEWGARDPKDSTPMVTPVPYVVIHHSAMPNCETRADCESKVKEIQDLHMDTRNWSDIGYNFLIGGDGSIFEGRGWETVGAHAPGFNNQSIGICLLGNFEESHPTPSQLAQAQKLIKCGVKKPNNGTEAGKCTDSDLNPYITGDYVLLGHRDTKSTLCPGKYLYEEILKWPHKGLPPKPYARWSYDPLAFTDT